MTSTPTNLMDAVRSGACIPSLTKGNEMSYEVCKKPSEGDAKRLQDNACCGWHYMIACEWLRSHPDASVAAAMTEARYGQCQAHPAGA